MAAAQGKLLFVQFSASWCMPCKWMEENTYQDQQLSAYLGANYVPLSVDVDEFEGLRDKAYYEVNFLPTIIIFNSSGQMVARHEESMDARRLLRILRKHNTSSNRQVDPFLASVDANTPKANTDHLRKPALIPARENNHTAAPTNSSGVATGPRRRPKYEVLQSNADIAQAQQRIFGIQVGAFSDYNNVVDFVSGLERRVGQSVRIETSRRNGNRIYKIIVGRFTDRPQAFQYKDSLQEAGIDGYLREISDL